MKNIAVIGLGYVGLPLAIEFAKKYRVVGFDINEERVAALLRGEDQTKEVDLPILKAVISAYQMDTICGLRLSNHQEDLDDCPLFIVTVPTPIDQFKVPNLVPLIKASELVARHLKVGDIVIYESTVYPGCTEEECVPVLEKVSGLKYNKDFFVGYSPERINPGDKVNTLTKIKKVTSGSTPEIAGKIDALYAGIITAGTHKAPSIKIAEASKAIENAQRDINISFMNELSLIFDRIGIDTHDVLDAAATKWNFLKYQPGLVGGHCIGADPYYLAYKAQALGYHPQVILSGRRVNDNMGRFVADKVVKLMIHKGQLIKGAKALILGFTFKENCPDVRNTRVVDIYQELKSFGLDVDIYDPWADDQEVKREYDVTVMTQLKKGQRYDSIVVAVAHDEFLTMNLEELKKENAVLFDTKSCLSREKVDGRL